MTKKNILVALCGVCLLLGGVATASAEPATVYQTSFGKAPTAPNFSYNPIIPAPGQPAASYGVANVQPNKGGILGQASSLATYPPYEQVMQDMNLADRQPIVSLQGVLVPTRPEWLAAKRDAIAKGPNLDYWNAY